MTKERFIQLIEKEQVPLRRFLLSLCSGCQVDADDLAQEAIIKAFIAIDSFRERSKFSTWLFRIAWNCYYDSIRQAKRRQTEPLDKESFKISGDSYADGSFKYQALYSAIDGLPSQERAVILLFYMEEYSVKEIVKILSLSPANVKIRLYRARKHIKQYLENNEKDIR